MCHPGQVKGLEELQVSQGTRGPNSCYNFQRPRKRISYAVETESAPRKQ
jgi:hypothetical protein